MKRALWIIVSAIMLISTVACNFSGTDSDLNSSDATNTPPVSSAVSATVPDDIPSSSENSDSESSDQKPSASQNSSASSNSSVSGGGQGDNPDTDHTAGNSRHYSYESLTDIQKTYYNALHTAVLEMQTHWIVLGEACENYKTDIAVVRNAIENDHPEIFWLPSYYATALNKEKNTALMYFSALSEGDPSYLITLSEKKIMEKELNEAVRDIASQVTATDPYEIELQLHDILCSRVSYSADQTDPLVYTAYGAIVKGKAICEGYTRAMQLLLEEFGIKSMPVVGVASGEGHMWNAVYIHGQWYNLDVTWNDTATGTLSHEYFNITDSQISIDHTFSKNFEEFLPGTLDDGTVSFNINRPMCDSEEYNYFVKTGFVFTPENISLLAEYLVSQDKSSVEVKFASYTFRNTFYANYQDYISRINNLLETDYSDCGFYIGGMSVSTMSLKLHKKTSAD